MCVQTQFPTVILKKFSVSWPSFAVIMYAICGLAFAFYLFRIPERFLPGKFDILGRPRSNVVFCSTLLPWAPGEFN
jgi:hypothetical protein